MNWIEGHLSKAAQNGLPIIDELLAAKWLRPFKGGMICQKNLLTYIPTSIASEKDLLVNSSPGILIGNFDRFWMASISFRVRGRVST